MLKFILSHLWSPQNRILCINNLYMGRKSLCEFNKSSVKFCFFQECCWGCDVGSVGLWLAFYWTLALGYYFLIYYMEQQIHNSTNVGDLDFVKKILLGQEWANWVQYEPQTVIFTVFTYLIIHFSTNALIWCNCSN